MKTRDTRSKLRLTNRAADALAVPGDRVLRHWDTECPQFYLRVTTAGTASYYLRYTKADGRDGDYQIGLANRVPTENARAVARAKLAAWTLHGIDPVKERKEARTEARTKGDRTLAVMIEAYIARKSKLRGGKPLSEWFMLRSYVVPALGDLDINQISEQRVIDTLEDIRIGVADRAARKNANGKSTAAQCHKGLKRFYKWAVASEFATKNPADFRGLFKGGGKKRYGKMDEDRFSKFWQAMRIKHLESSTSTLPLATMLYMATLQRPIDICQARKQDIDLRTKTWIIPDFLTKTGVEYFIPLSDAALAIINEAMRIHDGDVLFPGHRGGERISEASMTGCWSRVRKALLDQGAIEDIDVELYDCRRYGRTYIEMTLKFSEAVAEGVINHHSASRMESRYNVHNYNDEVRAAQTAWGNAASKFCGDASLAVHRMP